MMGDPWNVRLVPHYSLAVLLLFTHFACGLRNVLLGHRIAVTAATRTAAAVIVFGGAVAFTVTLAMLGVHFQAHEVPDAIARTIPNPWSPSAGFDNDRQPDRQGQPLPHATSGAWVS